MTMTNKEFFEQRGYMVLRNAFPAEFIGKYQTQLMMHYTDSSGPYRDLIFDLRTQLATKLVNYFQKE